MQGLSLVRFEGRWAVAKLPIHGPLPDWVHRAIAGDRFVSLTTAATERSLIAPEGLIPLEVKVERGFALLGVPGVISFSECGVLARLVGPLATAGISVLAVATFDTDYLLLRDSEVERARTALNAAGIPIV